MPTTPILGITQVSASQNSKEVTINDAIVALEGATNAILSVSFASGATYTLSATQATRNMVFKATGATGASELRFPISVNGNDFNRVFAVRNQSGHALTVKFASGAGSTVVIPNNESRLIAAIDGTDMRVAAEAPSTITFLSLTDTPSAYTGQGGKFLAVNIAENAIEFIDAAVFPSYTGNTGKVLAVNATEDGVEWVDVATTFLALTDAPDSYTGHGGKLVAVKLAENGVEFIDPPEAEAVEYPTATRWRIRTVTGGGETQVGWGEIELQDVNGIDLTGTGTATASTYDVGKEPAQAFNNTFSSGDGWLSEVADVTDSWIEYEFTSAVSVRWVKLWPVTDFVTFTPVRFIVERWNGTSWINVGERIPATWVSGTPQTFKINGSPLTSVADAPSDGVPYVRRNTGWEDAREWIRDVIGTALTAGSGISLTVNDAGDTITISASADAEFIRDTIGTALTAGAGITITVDDGGDTITITSRNEVVGDATTAYDVASGDNGKYRRFTSASAKTVNVRTNATHALPDHGEWHFRNVGAGDLTISPAGGVTINAPYGGTLVVPQNGTVTLKRVASDTFDLLGATVAA